VKINFCISADFIIRHNPSPLLPRVSASRANMSADKCHVEGFLTKNHAGSPFSKDNQRRWFDTTGFTVCYYRDVRTP
jgi:hypothetical protein